MKQIAPNHFTNIERSDVPSPSHPEAVRVHVRAIRGAIRGPSSPSRSVAPRMLSSMSIDVNFELNGWLIMVIREGTTARGRSFRYVAGLAMKRVADLVIKKECPRVQKQIENVGYVHHSPSIKFSCQFSTSIQGHSAKRRGRCSLPT